GLSRQQNFQHGPDSAALANSSDNYFQSRELGRRAGGKVSSAKYLRRSQRRASGRNQKSPHRRRAGENAAAKRFSESRFDARRSGQMRPRNGAGGTRRLGFFPRA